MPPRADVAELVDAHGSGPCGLRPVEVQVLSSAWAPRRGSVGDFSPLPLHPLRGFRPERGRKTLGEAFLSRRTARVRRQVPSAASTASAWVRGLTRRRTLASVPSGAITNVERSMPVYPSLP